MRLEPIVNPTPCFATQFIAQIKWSGHLRFCKVTADQYRELLAEGSGHSSYHELAWIRTVAQANGYKTVFYALFDGDTAKVLMPLLFKKIGPLSFCGSPLKGSHTEFMGPVYFSTTTQEDVSHFAQALLRMAQNFSTIFFGLYPFDLPHLPDQHRAFNLHLMRELQQGTQSLDPAKSGLIDLSQDWDTIWKACIGRFRTSVRKAEKNDITVEKLEGATIQARSDDIIGLLNFAFHRRDMVPPHSDLFLKKIFDAEHVAKKIFVAVKDGQWVAAAVFIIDGDRSVYFSGGANEVGLKLSGAAVLQCAAIQDNQADGLNWHDVGGFGDPNIDKFKLSLSPVVYERPVFEYSKRSFNFFLGSYQMLRKFMSKLGM